MELVQPLPVYYTTSTSRRSTTVSISGTTKYSKVMGDSSGLVVGDNRFVSNVTATELDSTTIDDYVRPSDLEYWFAYSQSVKGLANIDTSCVRSMKAAWVSSWMYDFSSLATWNTSRLENLDYTFRLFTGNTTSIDFSGIENWNISKVKSHIDTFKGIPFSKRPTWARDSSWGTE